MRDLDSIRDFITWCKENGAKTVEVGDIKVQFGHVAPPLPTIPPPPKAPEPEFETVDDETLATWSAKQ